jgi:hypothetical protein
MITTIPALCWPASLASESLSRIQVDLETANNPAAGALKGGPIVVTSSYQDPTYSTPNCRF